MAGGDAATPAPAADGKGKRDSRPDGMLKRVPVDQVFYTQTRISVRFRDGRHINDTIDELHAQPISAFSTRSGATSRRPKSSTRRHAAVGTAQST